MDALWKLDLLVIWMLGLLKGEVRKQRVALEITSLFSKCLHKIRGKGTPQSVAKPSDLRINRIYNSVLNSMRIVKVFKGEETRPGSTLDKLKLKIDKPQVLFKSTYSLVYITSTFLLLFFCIAMACLHVLWKHFAVLWNSLLALLSI